ncbi:MAG: MoaD/ThiS family protein [Acidobacteria bacterium]|nr:MoaD/ThiS family protein [Acidobacteriota bacterium]
MPITIRIPPPLRKYTNGAETVEATAQNLSELFEGLDQKFPGIKKVLCADDGTPQRFLNIYVNDEDIRFLGGVEYRFQEGDEVLLIPAIAGGSPEGAGKSPLDGNRL